MNVIGIIKDAFLFPSKNTGRFAVYLLLSVLMAGFAIGGILTYLVGFIDDMYYLLGGIYCVISLLIGFFVSGYHIKTIKSGIELSDEIPVFELYKDFMTGFDNIVVTIFYFIIPALIVVLVAFDTNLFSNATALVEEVIMQAYNVYVMGGSLNLATNAISQSLSVLMGSLTITVTAAIIIFLIFAVIQSMGEARLAKTGSLKEALNIFEAIKDIKRIGIVKVVIIAILMTLVIGLLEFALTAVFSHFPFLLTVVYVIITPYLSLVAQRAIGLAYSDIA